MNEENRKEDMTEEEKNLNPDQTEENPEDNGQEETAETGREPEEVSEGSEQAGEEEAETPEAAGDGEAGEEKAGQEEKEPGKKGFFGRKKEKKDPRDTQIEELTDRLRRNMAEFDNFRKRTEKEKSAMFEIGAKDIIERILPVIDNFERGLNSMPEDAKGSSFAEGMEMIYKQLLKNLEEAGVEPIRAQGQPFDPNFHNAVLHVEDENLGENVVAQELQKGYLYRGSVVRHTMVQVAN